MSRDKKRQIIWYQPDDSEAVTRHLEKMARKGWLLESVDNWYYTYRRSDPAEVKYAVTFFPEASYFDPGLLEGQETYVEYCKAAGWELAGAYGPIQYFRTANPDPPPIETDEALKLTAIRRTMRKTFVLTYALLMIFPAMGLPLSWRNFQNNPMTFFYSNIHLGSLLILSGIFLFSTMMLLDYLIWLLRSRYAVAHGGACCKPHTRFRLALNIAMMAICAAVLLLYLLDNSWQRGIFLAYILIYLGIMVLSRWFLRWLKAGNMDRSGIRAAYVTFAIVVGLVVGIGFSLLTIHLTNAGIIHTEREPAGTYVYTNANGFSYSRGFYLDDLPVTLEDLGYTVTADDYCSYEAEIGRSLLATRSRYTQEALNFDSALPDLFCQTYDTKLTWLLEKCWEFLIQSEKERYEPEILQKLDPAPWGALEVYQQERLRTYLLRYPNRIVTFHLGNSEADAQRIDRIAQALRP